MRRALDKLKQSVENEQHLEMNKIEDSIPRNEDAVKLNKEKRVAAKKEKVQYDNNQ